MHCFAFTSRLTLETVSCLRWIGTISWGDVYDEHVHSPPADMELGSLFFFRLSDALTQFFHVLISESLVFHVEEQVYERIVQSGPVAIAAQCDAFSTLSQPTYHITVITRLCISGALCCS